jgi:ABC-type transporter Mla maintaining outer membrane lipid asymmetry permease subunit MlaE
LNAYFIVVGLLGAYTTFWMLTQLPLNDFFIRLTQGLALSDVCVPLIKLILTGFLIGAICSYHGLKVGRAQTEIPQRIIMAVTQCTFALLLLHGIISLLTNNIEAT